MGVCMGVHGGVEFLLEGVGMSCVQGKVLTLGKGHTN